MSLHNEIMNLQIVPENLSKESVTDSGGVHIAYKLGHRDARHTAAEMAIQYDALMKLFLEMLDDYKDATDEWVGDSQEYGLYLIEQIEDTLQGGIKKGEMTVIKTGKNKGTPFWGNRVKDTSKCRIEFEGVVIDGCGCAFGQCVKGLIY